MFLWIFLVSLPLTLFSTSVELESDNVCMYACLSENRLETSKIVRFGWNFAHFFLGWIFGGLVFIFSKASFVYTISSQPLLFAKPSHLNTNLRTRKIFLMVYKFNQQNLRVLETKSAIQHFRKCKNSWPRPKNQNFEKMKKTPPGINSRKKCAKFQPNRTIFEVSSLPQSF